MSFTELIEWSVDRFPNKIAVKEADIARTFREIDNRANSVANALVELGVQKGDRVGVLVANRIEYPEVEMGILKAGAVRVPMLINSSTAEIKYYLEATAAKYIFVSNPALDAARQAVQNVQSPIPVQIISLDETLGLGELKYSNLLEQSSRRPRIDIVDSDPYAVRFTGGTTGLPKGILMSHRTMTNVVNNLILNWSISSDEVICHFHPLSHAAGKFMYTWWVRGGGQVVLPAFNFKPSALLHTISTERVTTLFIIPTALVTLLDSELVNEFDTTSLQRIVYGGAPMAPSRITQAVALFGPILQQIYGCSEAPNILTSLDPLDHVYSGAPPRKLQSVGRPAYNVELRILDPGGNDCEAEQPGRIISRGPHTMVEYWNDRALTEKRVSNGWVATGDIGYWDDEGYLYLVDREDDVIITGGFNVWPSEIEKVLAAHPAVAESAVFGVPDDKWGEVVTAVVVLKIGATVDNSELYTYLKQQVPKHKVPKNIQQRTSPLPKSGAAKILRRAAREEYLSENFPVVDFPN